MPRMSEPKGRGAVWTEERGRKAAPQRRPGGERRTENERPGKAAPQGGPEASGKQRGKAAPMSASEASERQSKLLAWPGAVEASWPDEGVAAHYGDPMREQRVAEESAALVDRSNRGVLRITGQDRLSWLHSLTTQHLDKLAAGTATQALVLSPNGHIEHHLTLTDDGTAVWLHVEPGTAAALAEFLESMRFMLRVEVADVSRDHAVLSVLGPGAGAA